MANPQAITVLSFGYKHAAPPAHFRCYDVRHLPNPFWEDELKHLTGLDPDIAAFFDQHTDVAAELDRYFEELQPLLGDPAQIDPPVIAFGCTGGQHRSVYLAHQLSSRLVAHFPGLEVVTVHRDHDKWQT